MSAAIRPLSPLGSGSPTADEVRRILQQAQPNALRLALLELTADEGLAAMRLETRAVRGGAMQVQVLARPDRERVVEAGLALLLSPRERAASQCALDVLLAAAGVQIEDPDRRELAIDELAPDERSPLPEKTSSRITDRKVTIIGAGVSGIAMAIRCREAGIPFEILERQSAVGGTWQLNDYPEARVDISNFIYQFRFEAGYPWTQLYATQPEIRQYLEHIVDRFDLRPHIQLGVTVRAATWNEARGRWDLLIEKDGNTRSSSTDFLISASGLFSSPNLPDIPGLGEFKGPAFHTTAWRHDFEFAGKRIALIGNGSSGVQVTPWLAERAGKLTVYQRSPNWIAPIDDYFRPINPEQTWLFQNLPGYWRWFCFAMGQLDKQVEDLQVTETHAQWSNTRHQRFREFLTGYIEGQLADRADLLRACVPNFPPLARRLVVDSGWYRALKRDNVELVPEAVVEVTADGVRSASGRFEPFDGIVLATGFRAADFLCALDLTGRDGMRTQDLWARDGARAYLGLFLPQFPNFMLLYGPNGQPQAGGFHEWADRWARTAVTLIREVVQQDAKAFTVRREAYDSYNDEMDAAMSAMVWGRDGASGYYINEFGRPITKMPWRSHDYFRRLNRLDLGAFDIA